MADAEGSLLLKILGDSTGGQKAMRDVASATKSSMAEVDASVLDVVNQLKTQGRTAAQAGSDLAQMGIKGERAASAIAAAFEGVQAAVGSATEAIARTGEALAQLVPAAGKAGVAMQNAGRDARDSFYKAYAASQLLGRDLGVNIPFALARMAGRLESLQPLMSAAFSGTAIVFAVEQVAQLVEELRKANEEAQGFGEKLNEYYRQEYEAQLTREPTLRLQQEARAEVEKQIVAINRLIEIRKEEKSGEFWKKEAADAKELVGIYATLRAANIDLNKLEDERIRLSKLYEQTNKSVTEKQRESGTLQIEVYRAQAAALDATGNKAGALGLKLRALALEQKAAIEAAGQDQDKVLALQQIYAARAVELRNQESYARDTQGRKEYNAEVALMEAGIRQQELAMRTAQENARVSLRLQESLATRLKEVNAGFDKQVALGEKWLAFQERLQGKEIRPGRAESETWMAQQARTGVAALERLQKTQTAIVEAEPAFRVAIEQTYGQISIGAAAAIPGIQKVAQAWKDQGAQIAQSVQDTLDRLQQFENILPTLDEKANVTFVHMSAVMQQFTLTAANASRTFMTAMNQQLELGANLGKAMRAGFADAIKATAEYYAGIAVIHAAADIAYAIEALASFDFVRAAEYFAAAAAWGALGGAISAAGGALAGAIGGGQARTRGGGASTGGGAGGGGYGSADRGSGAATGRTGYTTPMGPGSVAAQPNVVVHVQGMISADNLASVVAQINQGVQSGRMTLTSSASMATPIQRS